MEQLKQLKCKKCEYTGLLQLEDELICPVCGTTYSANYGGECKSCGGTLEKDGILYTCNSCGAIFNQKEIEG